MNPPRGGGVRIAGLGHHAPDRRVPNAEIEAMLDLAPGWVARRTGIQTRHWAAPDDTLCDLAAQAGAAALPDGFDPAGIGLLLLATSTPDRRLPPTAPLLAHRLGLTRCASLDAAGACAGFLHALVLADGFVRVHRRPALVVAANILSRRIAPDDRSCAALFADAAGAVLLFPDADPRRGILGLDLATDGEGHTLVAIPPGEEWMRIGDAGALFTRAVRIMVDCAAGAMRAAELDPAAITRFVPHQANGRIIDRVAAELGLTGQTQRSIEQFGNSSAATIPLTLSLAHAAHPLQAGERLLLAAAGAGLTGGGLVWGV